MATDRQKTANRNNAALSTGPKSAAGKAKASANARSHGILSTALVLPHENQAEFDAMLSTLIAELNAVGTLEMALVERIAIAMWRQKRLVAVERNEWGREADSASFGMDVTGLEPQQIDRQLKSLDDADLLVLILRKTSLAENLYELEVEAQALDPAVAPSDEDFVLHFPRIHSLLRGMENGPNWPKGERYAKNVGDFKSLKIALSKAIAKLRIERAAQNAGRSGAALPKNSDSLTRYQSALDNEWYKAMRALREAQAARLRTVSVG
jgi:hypothetical protein